MCSSLHWWSSKNKRGTPVDFPQPGETWITIACWLLRWLIITWSIASFLGFRVKSFEQSAPNLAFSLRFFGVNVCRKPEISANVIALHTIMYPGVCNLTRKLLGNSWTEQNFFRRSSHYNSSCAAWACWNRIVLLTSWLCSLTWCFLLTERLKPLHETLNVNRYGFTAMTM